MGKKLFFWFFRVGDYWILGFLDWGKIWILGFLDWGKI
jgi:hypothetical protein